VTNEGSQPDERSPEGISVGSGAHTEEFLRKIFRRGNDAIFVIDLDAGEIRDVNARTCEMLGYDRADLIGASPEKRHPDEMATLRASRRWSEAREAGSSTSWPVAERTTERFRWRSRPR